MINTINSYTTYTPQSTTTPTLSTSQLDLITSTLKQYDANNLTTEEALTISKTFSDAGIQPSKALQEAMKTEGFDAKEVGDLSGAQGAGGKPPPPPKQTDTSSVEFTSIIDYINELTTDSDDISSEELYTKVLEKFGLETEEPLLSLTI